MLEPKWLRMGSNTGTPPVHPPGPIGRLSRPRLGYAMLCCSVPCYTLTQSESNQYCFRANIAQSLCAQLHKLPQVLLRHSLHQHTELRHEGSHARKNLRRQLNRNPHPCGLIALAPTDQGLSRRTVKYYETGATEPAMLLKLDIRSDSKAQEAFSPLVFISRLFPLFDLR
jgi:hypothetical protein